jgi:hypothetical protein
MPNARVRDPLRNPSGWTGRFDNAIGGVASSREES